MQIIIQRPYVKVGEERTNSFGFNDIEHQKDKRTKDDIRVVVMGDSFVFGVVPRKDNFVSGMQEFAGRSNSNVEMWNMGVPAAGPEKYLSLIREDAVAAEADLVCDGLFCRQRHYAVTPGLQDKSLVWRASRNTALALLDPTLTGVFLRI